VIEIRKTEVFARWLDDLGDLRARARIQARIERLAAGNPGDVKVAGEGVSELRIDYPLAIACISSDVAED
jgi:putative addiction module killer protein